MKTIEIKACFKVDGKEIKAKCNILESLIDHCANVQFQTDDFEFSKQVVVEQARIILKQRCSKFVSKYPGKVTPDFSDSVSDSLLISVEDWLI